MGGLAGLGGVGPRAADAAVERPAAAARGERRRAGCRVAGAAVDARRPRSTARPDPRRPHRGAGQGRAGGRLAADRLVRRAGAGARAGRRRQRPPRRPGACAGHARGVRPAVGVGWLVERWCRVPPEDDRQGRVPPRGTAAT
nr:hypothetical protein [Angustibacter aerolatus]